MFGSLVNIGNFVLLILSGNGWCGVPYFNTIGFVTSSAYNIIPEDMNFDPVKYVNETLSRGEKLTLLHFLRKLIGRYLTQVSCPINDREKWIKVNFSPRDKVSFTYFTGPKFIPPGTNS